MQQDENQEVINEFGKRKKKQWIVTGPIIIAAFGMVSLEDMEGTIAGIPAEALFFICLGLIFAGVIFSIINWRCPSCGTNLGKGMSPKFCRKCGVQLQL